MTTQTVLTVGVLGMLASLASGQESAAPAEALPRPEQLTPFDPRAVQIQRREGHWIVAAGDLLLKDCGRREEDARAICHLIQQLNLDRHGVIGRPRPVMEYWLSGGQPPRALPGGLRVLPLHPQELQVDQSQGFWVLREKTRVLFNFGPDELEARQALAVIAKYGFDRIGVVGQAVPAMLLPVAAADALSNPASQLRQKELEAPPKPESSRPTGLPTFYPTPILPALAEAGKQSMLLERGRPSRAARASEDTPPMSDVAVGRYPFDPRQAQVRRENNDWVLMVGTLKLANFGQSERYARVAQAALQHYRLNEMVTVGTPESAFRYFLASGQAPRGLMVGIMAERFVTERLEVRAFGGQQCLAQGSHPILDCGTRIEDAQHLLGVVRRFGFDHVLRVGQTDAQSMRILVRSY